MAGYDFAAETQNTGKTVEVLKAETRQVTRSMIALGDIFLELPCRYVTVARQAYAFERLAVLGI